MSDTTGTGLSDEVKEIVDNQLKLLKNFTNIPLRRDELELNLGDTDEMSKMEVEKNIFLYYAKRLRDNPEEHKLYNAEKVPDGLWQPITRLLTAIRVQELKDVKVTKRKGKYDIKELKEAYFGKKIVDDLAEIGGRWMLKEDEFKKVLLQCRKLNLELPTVVEPTTTEKFFDDD